jgi:hypothetical protein
MGTAKCSTQTYERRSLKIITTECSDKEIQISENMQVASFKNFYDFMKSPLKNLGRLSLKKHMAKRTVKPK